MEKFQKPVYNSFASVVAMTSMIQKYTDRAVHHLLPENIGDDVYMQQAIGAETSEDWDSMYNQMKEEIQHMQNMSKSNISLDTQSSFECGKTFFLQI